MFGLGVVCLAMVLSLLVYVVSPDNSPSANEQIVQLETQPPGYSIYILKKHRQGVKTNSLPESLYSGFIKDYEPIPVSSFTFGADSLKYNEYRGKAFRTEEKKLA